MSTCHVIGDIYGFSPTGVETTQGAWLLGFNENLFDRIQRVLLSDTAHGRDIKLTIDSGMNIEIANILGDYRGAAAVLNYKTGEILSMVSLPEFDLKEIDVSQEHGGADEKSLPNRVLQGSYPPGELFKVVTAAAAMEYLDLVDESLMCEGDIRIENDTIFCNAAHGQQTFEEAVQNYCIVSLSQLAIEMGESNLEKAAGKLGFNFEFLFGDVVLYSSDLAISSLTSDYDLAQAAIGEAHVTVTPMHMAMLYGAIANGGKMMPLKLLSDIEGVDMDKRNYNLRKSFEYAIAHKLNDILKTDEPIVNQDMLLCGVSCEVEYETEDYDSVTWYVGYSSDESLPYSIAFVLEDYDGSPEDAKVIARQIFQKIIENGE
jgi:peptidoglycan glycosyltransferase